MSMEQLKKINEVEGQADKIRKDGLAESKRLVSKAKEDAAALVDDAQLKADAMYRDVLSKAEAEAQLAYDQVISKAESDCTAILANAGKKLDNAVSVIVGRVVN